ncbi:MAG TPA: hypothetical protein PLU87_17150 [Sedimentisphaerales bacterium]|nr:hypothetical protein [Sedimentisphaerales bacterium]HRS12702.1 hypothetical protein [Sedimentisphaerales bacterium]HRV49316.1 hypothetical protein [Sedimentisphaerales bacterium]
MEREDDILQRAIEQYRNEPVPAHPPQAVVDATVAKLGEAAGRTADLHRRQYTHVFRLTTRLAAAAAVLMFAGYAVGRLSAPRTPDTEQLRQAVEASLATIEPKVRQKVIEDLSRQWQATLEATCVALREDLTVQYRNDMAQVAVQTLAASNANTNRLLEDLIEAISVAQAQNRQWLAAGMQELDAARRQDNTCLAGALVSFASALGGEFERTKQDMVNLVAGIRAGSPGPDPFDAAAQN